MTTETVLVSTTVCPVEATTTGPAPGSIITGSPALPSQAGGNNPPLTTETVLTSRTVTVTACPATVTDCPARQKTTSVIPETLVASTSVYEVVPTPTQTAGNASNPGTELGEDNGGAGPTATEIATVNPGKPLPTVHSTRLVTVYACSKKDKLLV